MEKCLKKEEVLELELSHKCQLIKKLEKLLLEKDSAIIKQQAEQLRLKVKLLESEDYKLQQKIVNKSDQISEEMVKAKEFHTKLEEKYELTPGWGFNPDSYEIILKED